MFVENFRDYLDHVHTLPAVLNGDLSLGECLKIGFVYCVESIVGLIGYVFSFQWVLGFKEIPLLFRHTYTAIVSAESAFDFRPALAWNQGFFSFLETGNYHSTNIGTGLLNSFFITLPLSISQLLSLRALLINGVPAAIFSALGMLIGQFIFFTCVLFGFEFILVPWLSIHPVAIVAGACIVVSVVYRMSHSNSLGPIPASNRKAMFRFLRTTLFLSWCEQICIYSCLGNLTVTAGTSTVLETSGSNFLFSTFGYLIGLTLGSVFWTVLWGFASVAVRDFVFDLSFLQSDFKKLNRWLNRGCLVLAFSFSLASFPYYGADYLAGSTLGLPYGDHFFNGISNQLARGNLPAEDTPHEFKGPFYHSYRVPNWETVEAIDDEGEEYVTVGDEIELDYDSFVSRFASRDRNKPTMYQLEETSYNQERRWSNRLKDRTRVPEDVTNPFMKDGPPDTGISEPLILEQYVSARVRKHEARRAQLEEEEKDIERRALFANLRDGKASEEEITEPKERYYLNILMKDELDYQRDNNESFEERSERYRKEAEEVERRRKSLKVFKSYLAKPSDSNAVAKLLDRPDTFATLVDSRDEEEYEPAVEVEHAFRMKYFANPIYRFVLKLDMFPFLFGQSPDQANSAEQEAALYTYRNLVQNYANSLTHFKGNPKNTLGFSRRVTNNQFKGSMNLIRQYKFATVHETVDREPSKSTKKKKSFYDPEQAERLKKLKVLKYDQPLFQTIKNQEQFLFHEELELSDKDLVELHNKDEEEEEELELDDEEELELDDEEEPELDDEKNFFGGVSREENKRLLQEELNDPNARDLTELIAIGADQSVPMYIGWDGSMRKFLVKTRVAPNEIETMDETYTDPYGVSEDLDLDEIYASQKDKKGKVRQLSEQEKEDIKQQYEQYSPYFSVETDRPKKDVPTYYNFQAWSTSVDSHVPGDETIHLPAANYKEGDKRRIKVLAKLMKDNPKEQAHVDSLFDHLPNYNWFFRRSVADEKDPLYHYAGHFELGNTAPPKLKGFAWPGIADPSHRSQFEIAGGTRLRGRLAEAEYLSGKNKRELAVARESFGEMVTPKEK